LELDAEHRDRYGRLLAYVWVGPTMVNAELVRGGYARALPIPPNLRHARLFAALESAARAARRGLWASHPPASVVSYERSAAPPAPPTERRLWRSTRHSHSTPSIGCSRVSSSFRASRRWSGCRSTSTVPISGEASTPPP